MKRIRVRYREREREKSKENQSLVHQSLHTEQNLYFSCSPILSEEVKSAQWPNLENKIMALYTTQEKYDFELKLAYSRDMCTFISNTNP